MSFLRQISPPAHTNHFVTKGKIIQQYCAAVESRNALGLLVKNPDNSTTTVENVFKNSLKMTIETKSIQLDMKAWDPETQEQYTLSCLVQHKTITIQKMIGTIDGTSKEYDAAPVFVDDNGKFYCHVSVTHSTKPFILKADSLCPRALQNRALKVFADTLASGKKHQLALMATGTGKSFVQAGATHATGEGIYILPNTTLAQQFKADPLEKIHKSNPELKIHISTDFNLAQFAELLKNPNNKHIILVAEDEDYAEKSALLKNQIVLIDESHEHTLNEKIHSTLKSIMDHNAVLLLTGTPTAELLHDKRAMRGIDLDLHLAMKRGQVRKMHVSETTTKAERIDIDSMAHYLGNVELIDLEDSKKMAKSLYENAIKSMSEDKKSHAAKTAILQTMKESVKPTLQEKNFIFSKNAFIRKSIKESYDNLLSEDSINTETTNQLILKWGEIQLAMLDKQIERTSILVDTLILNSSERESAKAELTSPLIAKKNWIKLNVQNTSTDITKVKEMLRKQMISAQKQQIIRTVKACALHALFYKEKEDYTIKDFEKALRGNTGSLTAYFQKKGMPKANTDEEAAKIIAELYKHLQAKQRQKLMALIQNAADSIRKNPTKNPEDVLAETLTLDKIDLTDLSASYMKTVSAQSSSEAKAESPTCLLDQLRTGLVMHIASDQTFSTGIDIPSVLSTQHLVMGREDLDELYLVQLLGRPIRDKDSFAHVYQVVSEQYKKTNIELQTLTHITEPSSTTPETLRRKPSDTGYVAPAIPGAQWIHRSGSMKQLETFCTLTSQFKQYRKNIREAIAQKLEMCFLNKLRQASDAASHAEETLHTLKMRD